MNNSSFVKNEKLIKQYLEYKNNELSDKDLTYISKSLDKENATLILNNIYKENSDLDNSIQIQRLLEALNNKAITKEFKEKIKQIEKYNFNIKKIYATINIITSKHTKMVKKKIPFTKKTIKIPKIYNHTKDIDYSLSKKYESQIGNGKIQIYIGTRGRKTKKIDLNYTIINNNIIIFKDKDKDGKLNRRINNTEFKYSIIKAIPEIPHKRTIKGKTYEGFENIKIDISKALGKNVKKFLITLQIKNKNNRHRRRSR